MHESEERQPSSFRSFPAPRTGKWSAWLLLLSVLLILLNALVFMPQTEQRNLELAQRALNLIIFLCVFSSGFTALWAFVIKRERSWALFISVLLLILAIALNLGPLFNG